MGTRLATVCADLLTYFADRSRAVFGFEHPPVHDPVAVAAVIDPSIVRTVAAPVAGELTGSQTPRPLWGGLVHPPRPHPSPRAGPRRRCFLAAAQSGGTRSHPAAPGAASVDRVIGRRIGGTST